MRALGAARLVWTRSYLLANEQGCRPAKPLRPSSPLLIRKGFCLEKLAVKYCELTRNLTLCKNGFSWQHLAFGAYSR